MQHWDVQPREQQKIGSQQKQKQQGKPASVFCRSGRVAEVSSVLRLREAFALQETIHLSSFSTERTNNSQLSHDCVARPFLHKAQIGPSLVQDLSNALVSEEVLQVLAIEPDVVPQVLLRALIVVRPLHNRLCRTKSQKRFRALLTLRFWLLKGKTRPNDGRTWNPMQMLSFSALQNGWWTSTNL